MQYAVYGEFPIARNGSLISRSKLDKGNFWAGVEEMEPELSEACGCYVFVIRGRAWYVGMAEKQSFKQECFALHKITQYNEALGEVSGKPSLILLPKMTPGGRFAKPTSRGHSDIRLLENMLIGSALGRNPNLQNVKGTKLLREMNVPGFLNPRPGQARASKVQAFKRAIGA
ncbi:MAG: hypothetical protein ACR2LC_04350 [Pyrinomonadaceae bacterium]